MNGLLPPVFVCRSLHHLNLEVVCRALGSALSFLDNDAGSSWQGKSERTVHYRQALPFYYYVVSKRAHLAQRIVAVQKCPRPAAAMLQPTPGRYPKKPTDLQQFPSLRLGFCPPLS